MKTQLDNLLFLYSLEAPLIFTAVVAVCAGSDLDRGAVDPSSARAGSGTQPIARPLSHGSCRGRRDGHGAFPPSAGGGRLGTKHAANSDVSHGCLHRSLCLFSHKFGSIQGLCRLLWDWHNLKASEVPCVYWDVGTDHTSLLQAF